MTDHMNPVVEALFIQTDLERGRRFSELPRKVLEDRYVAMFKALMVEGRGDCERPYFDLVAELSLRNLPRPEPCERDMQIILHRVEASVPDERQQAALRERVEQFLREFSKKRH